MKKWIVFEGTIDFVLLEIAWLIAQITSNFIINRKLRKRVRKHIKTKIADMLFFNKYDCIFSAGEACFVATALNAICLRKFSGPMDWMFGSDPITRLNLIANEYKSYFEKGDFQYHGFSESNSCDIYINKQTGLHYNHDFSGNGDFDRDYPAIYEKYQKRISRVVDMMKSGAKTLIIYADLEKKIHFLHQPELSEISKAVQLINNTYGNNVDVLYLAHNPEMKPGTARIIPKKSNLIYGEYFGYDPAPASMTAKKTSAVLSKVIAFAIRK